MRKSILLIFLLISCLTTLGQTAEEYFKPLKYRSIGPFRGGRSNCASGVLGDPMTYYMGTTGGGLWKTHNGGQNWYNISDGFFETGSVGAVAVSASDPNVVYCGMGEHAIRGVMTSYGDGVYKSIDAGETWKKIGLEKSQHISRIVIHPNDPNTVFIAAQGALFAPNSERGIYKSTDGGENWRKVLFVNDSTGGVELSMDPKFPHIMYAAMWQHQRTPWKVISGGSGSGLYKSVDAGESWSKIHNGLPSEKGKMAVAVAPSNPKKVYALVESDSQQDKGGLFVSANAGESWSMVSGDNRLTQRAWYYTEVFVDPNDENNVYVLSAPALRSQDGGKTWERLFGTHGDYHDLWINPNNSRNMVIANDGGAAVSYDFGETWSPQNQMPTAQFYRISVDNLFPYNVYAGQQDNSSVKIASMSHGRRSIGREDWTYAAGGESAFLAFDPDNPAKVMGGSYLGTIELLDMNSKISNKVMAAPIQYLGRAARDMKYLFNWNAPIIKSVHEPNTYYHAAQLVLRTTDEGLTWEEMSPDLTRNQDAKQGKGGGPYTVEAVGAENYGTLAYFIESQHEAGVFYSGSDDGYVFITQDNGDSWKNITPKGLQECLINAIEVSPHDPATVYIATTRYKFNDYTPAIYKSTNYGKNWTNISDGIPYGAFTRVVREDQERRGLLYAGTEKGIFISWNDGKKWEPFQLNLPITPITDLKVHRGNLVVATSGRSFWILDDLSLISQYQPKSENKIYQPADATYGFWGSPMSGNIDTFGGAGTEGVNPANGVVLYYQLGKLVDTVELKLRIKNSEGEMIRELSSSAQKGFQRYAGGPSPEPSIPKKEGLNRFVWDMSYPTMPGIPTAYIEASYRGHRVSPGTYTVELTAGDIKLNTEIVILPSPFLDISDADYQEFDQFMKEMEELLTVMHTSTNQLYGYQMQLVDALAELEQGDLKAEGTALLEMMRNWDEDMVQRKSKAYDDVENFENKFTAEYMFLINQSNSAIPQINLSSQNRRMELEEQWAGLKERFDVIVDDALPAYNAKLWEAGIGAIRIKRE